ncbi:gamma-parvin isoform X4 [Mauremys reevesii]|uniref:gamma-parvin isoform X4 n=1 Tax=Mauremys reevesii TaxID=260615 RepID=UPI00193FED32|nr:gamma-parvin isoform X4 [Mauremys reevesii]
MEPDFFTAFAQPSALHHSPLKNDAIQGEKRKFINPTSCNNPKLEELQMLLIDWINTTLKQEHIVVKSLEEDLFDGLILHHLLEKLGSLRLEVEKIALTEKKQKHKLAVILEAVAQSLQLEESQLKWSVDCMCRSKMQAIFQKDLLSTLYLLIAIAKHFQPDLPIPSNISVEVIIIERTLTGLRTENAVEYITENRENLEGQAKADAFDELFTHAPDKLDAVKKFADGVILLLLIGQLGGYFLNLREFFLTPNCATEMLHNVNLAVALLTDGGLLDFPVNAEDIVNRDMKTTLQVLYCLYSKYKTKET